MSAPAISLTQKAVNDDDNSSNCDDSLALTGREEGSSSPHGGSGDGNGGEDNDAEQQQQQQQQQEEEEQYQEQDTIEEDLLPSEAPLSMRNRVGGADRGLEGEDGRESFGGTESSATKPKLAGSLPVNKTLASLKGKRPSLSTLSITNQFHSLNLEQAVSEGFSPLRGRAPAYSIDIARDESGSLIDYPGMMEGDDNLERSMSDDFDSKTSNLTAGINSQALSEEARQSAYSSLSSSERRSSSFNNKSQAQPISRPSQIRKWIVQGAVRRTSPGKKVGTVKTFGNIDDVRRHLLSSNNRTTNSSPSVPQSGQDPRHHFKPHIPPAVAAIRKYPSPRSTSVDGGQSPPKIRRTLSVDIQEKSFDSETSGDSSSSILTTAFSESAPGNRVSPVGAKLPPIGGSTSIGSTQFRSKLRRLSKTDSQDSEEPGNFARTMSLGNFNAPAEANNRILKGINLNRHRMAGSPITPQRRVPGTSHLPASGTEGDNGSDIGSLSAVSMTPMLDSPSGSQTGGTVTVHEISDATVLSRGGVRVNTSIGAIQFGIPPETIKDSLKEGFEVPSYFVVPKDRFDVRLGINMCEVEFPAYFNFFIKKRFITLITSKEDEEVVCEVLRETLEGPSEEHIYTDSEYIMPSREGGDEGDEITNRNSVSSSASSWSWKPVEPRLGFDARPDHMKEIGFFKRPREGREIAVNSLVKFVHFIPRPGGVQQSQRGIEATFAPLSARAKHQRRYTADSVDSTNGSSVTSDAPKAIPRSTTPEITTMVADLGSNVLVENTGVEYIVWDQGKAIARIDVFLASHVPNAPLRNPVILPHQVVDPPVFGVTVLGSSHGFDSIGSTSGFVLWINKKGIMVDPPPNSTTILQASGIVPNMIDCVILTHCHADHDAGTFQKILKEGRVMLMTTQTICESFIRKYSVISGFTEAFLSRLFEPRCVNIGEPVPYNGAVLRFFYSLHALPCVGFEAFFQGKRFVYSADTYYDPQGLQKLHEEGILSKGRLQALLDFPFHYDLVLHEAGIPPIHTPVSALQSIPEECRKNLYIIHIKEVDAAKSELRLARAGVDNSIIILKDKPNGYNNQESLLMFVQGTDLFRSLNLEQAKEIISLCKFEEYEPGELVCRAGDIGKHFFLIFAGFAIVELGDPSLSFPENEARGGTIARGKHGNSSRRIQKSSTKKGGNDEDPQIMDGDDLEFSSALADVIVEDDDLDYEDVDDERRSRGSSQSLTKQAPATVESRRNSEFSSSSRSRSLSTEAKLRRRTRSQGEALSFSPHGRNQRIVRAAIEEKEKLSEPTVSLGPMLKSIQPPQNSLSHGEQSDDSEPGPSTEKSSMVPIEGQQGSVEANNTEDSFERKSTILSSVTEGGRDSSQYAEQNHLPLGQRNRVASLSTNSLDLFNKTGTTEKLFGVGDYLGELSLLDGSVRSASIRAFTTLSVISFDEACFSLLLEKNPTFRERLQKLAKTRASGSWRAIEANSVFSQLGASPRSDLQSTLSVKFVPSGTKLWTRGEPVTASCLIGSGEMTFVEMHEELDLPFRAGAFLCDICSILNQGMLQAGEEPDGPVEATVTLLALTDCTLFMMENADAIDFMNKNPGILLNLVDSLVIE